jgi:glycosyltransferase involved in cell wall biosynthesis
MPELSVSAIITAYNSEQFIADAISSVLDQSHPVDDILVVDDGSTDRTWEIVASFAERGVRYVYQENQGPGAARNTGLRETNGELIAFLDADDIWLKEKTEIQKKFLSDHPEIALVSGFEWWWNVTKNKCSLVGDISPGMESLRRDILVYNRVGNPSRVMFRRSVLAEVGVFNPAIRWGQDWELWIRMVRRYQSAMLPTPVIVYRWHEKNLSHTKRWERLYSYWNISLRAIRTHWPPWQRPFLMLRSWSLFTLRRARYLIQTGSRWRAVGYASAAFFAYPVDMGLEKLKVLLHAAAGDKFYLYSKQLYRWRWQVRG